MPSTVSSSRLGLAGLCILLAGQLLPMIDFSIVIRIYSQLFTNRIEIIPRPIDIWYFNSILF